MTHNQTRPWNRGGGGGGRGRGGAGGGGSYRKQPFEANRFRGGSTSSTGSFNVDKDAVVPIYINPKLDRSQQLEQLKKERPGAKYNVLLPFRRAKIFYPRSYQQFLYTPTLILVQEIFSLAEASCMSPLTSEEENKLSNLAKKEESGPKPIPKKQPTRYVLDG